MPSLLEINGLRGKKFNKAIENFTHNLALLHVQTDLLNKAQQDACTILRQVHNLVMCRVLIRSSVAILCIA
jgi:hypothetical protein